MPAHAAGRDAELIIGENEFSSHGIPALAKTVFGGVNSGRVQRSSHFGRVA